MKKEKFEDELLTSLLEFQHQAISLESLKKNCQNVEWAKGYPDSVEAFWNCEAFMWERKIENKKRKVIELELQKCIANNKVDSNKILDIGSGSYSYLPCVAFDCSFKMLKFNEVAINKIKGDLEKRWPFAPNSFELITAIFVLNYISDLKHIFSESQKVLTDQGKMLVILSATGVSDLHQIHETQNKSFEEWNNFFSSKFKVNSAFEKEQLWFFELLLT